MAADPVHPQALGYLRAESAPLAVAVVPVLHRGEVRGLLAAHRESGRPFDERDSALLSRCARILDGWESFAAHGQRLEEMQGRQDRVVRGLQRMLLEPDPLEIAGLALDTLFDLLPALYGFAVIQHEEANLYALVTKRFQGPEHFERLERDTWSYWIMTRGRKSLYLEGATGKETAMPLLHAEESFPADRVAFLQPLATKEDPYGVVGLVGREDNPFPEEDRKEAAFFLGQAAALMELGFVNTMLQEQAMRDPLTGLFNRRHFGEQLEFELRRSRREKTPVSLLIADIDHFKKINDTYGHPMGDRVLRDMAACISGAVREVDITCRYGGEEFAVILPSCPNGEAARVGERIREVVEASHFPREGADRIKLTVSLGLSSSSSPSANAEELVHLADKALYRAKREGRNRLSSHP
ncbi:MAG: sensor domain-containing diguanylate cyclase [Acidobacteriota bacterium]